MNRRFAIFDQAALGPNLDIRQSGEVLGIIGTGLNTNRTARGNIAVTGGVRTFEQIVWGEDDMEAVVGVVTADASLSLPVGSAGGVGYDLASGDIRVDGSTVATVDPVAKGSVVGVRLDLELNSVTFRVDSIDAYVVDISGSEWGGAEWYIGTSLGSDAGGDDSLQAFLSTGQREFVFPDPVNPLGWYTTPVQISPVWLGSHDYITKPTDDPPNQVIDGCVPLRQSALQIARKLAFWMHSDGEERPSMTAISAASMPILDDTHAYDNLISGDVRDVPVWLLEMDDTDDFADATTIGRFLLDKVTVSNDIAKQITLKDNSVRLDNPLQRLLFPPSVDSTAANRPYRITLGVGFSIDPLLYDAANRGYNLHDRPILGMGFVRDMGQKLDSTIPDYTLTPDARGIHLENNPAGKITVDMSSVGGDQLTPPTNLLPSTLAGWDETSEVTQTGGEYRMADAVAGNAWTVQAYLKINAILGSMKTYRYRFTINDMSRYFGGTGQITRLQFIRQIGSGGVPLLQLPVSIEWPAGAVAPITYTGTFQNFSAGTNDFIVAMVGTQSGSDFIDLADDLELFEVDTTPVDSANLVPMKLGPFMRDILGRAGFQESDYDATTADAVDAITMYDGIGWHASEQVPVRQPFNDVLPSYGCCLAQGRDGVFRVYRMVAPENETSVGTIEWADLLSDLRIELDEARGLTNQFGLQRNETVLDPTDFVDNFDPVTGIDLLTRAKLSRRYREIVATGGSFSNAYPFAYSAPALGTRFVRVADAQTELDRIRAIFAVERKFYTAEISMDAEYELGEIYTLVYPYYGLQAGKKLMVYAIVEDRINNKCTLTLWG